MQNQHAGLSQVLAEPRMTERHEQAAHARLACGARRRRRSQVVCGWWQLARWPRVATDQPVAHTASVDRSEGTMSKRARTLIIGATLTAMHLVGMTAVAQAQANEQPAGKQAALRPPAERQVGESWRHRQAASQEQAAADTAHRRQTAQEQSYNLTTTPAQVPAPVPAKPSSQAGWLIASLAVLVAALALSGGLAVRAAKRTRRRARLEHAA
jgi:hypothetical protein